MSILIASVMCFHCRMQEEDIFEHTNAKCHLCTLESTCRPLCNIGIHLITILNILMPKISISALEHQVSRGDTNDEVVDYLV